MSDFESPEGYWEMVALHGLQQKRQRKDVQTLVAARVQGGDPPSGAGKEGNAEMKGMVAMAVKIEAPTTWRGSTKIGTPNWPNAE